MKKYIGTWSANGGATFPCASTESENKNKLFSLMKACARGETFAGNEWHAVVWRADDEDKKPILEAWGIGR